jgi:hypothetical protein
MTTVIALTPGVPILLAPQDGTITTSRAITFTWTPTGTGAIPVGYNLKLDGSIVITTTLTTSPTILPVGVHTWTVRAYNSFGYSAWASFWQVEVVRHDIYLPLLLQSR